STSFPTLRPKSRVSEYISFMCEEMARSRRFFFSMAVRAHFLNLNVCSIRSRQMGHDVVVPSLPGFAFSKPISGVIGPRRAAELMHALMVELFGPSRYIVQGG